MGSLHQYQIVGREVGTDGGYRQEGQQDSSRLLTLPTILTIGRVAFVPLLVSSRSILSLSSFLLICLHLYMFL